MSSSDQVRTYSRSESVVFLKTDEPFGGLSNMAGGYPIRVNGIRILTSEALYQACRFPYLPDVQRMIIGENSPMTAKMRSKPHRKDSRRDWDHVRVRIMRWCLRMKLASNWSAFSELLLRTGDRPIVEQSRKDDFWGAKPVGDGSTLVGMNVLGRLLMELREQVKEHGRDAFLRVELPGIPDFQLLGRPIEVWALEAAQQGAAVLAMPQAGLFGDDLTMESSSATAPTSVTAAAQTAEHSSMPVRLPVDADVALAAGVSPISVSDWASAYPSYRTARMRWLPPVPEHWNEQRAKTHFREVDERSRTGQEELLSVSHLTGVTPRSQKNVTMFKAASYVGHKVCRPGDIVVNTLWAWMAALGASTHTGLVSPAYGIYRPRNADSFNPGYLDYLLRTRAYVAEYIGRSTGIRSSRLRLYPNQFLDIPLLEPPRAEQDQIVAYLRAQDAHVARFINAKRDLIALLTEQKLRIIDHAVTRGLDSNVPLQSTDIQWLGDVPAHWELRRLKFLASNVTNQTTVKGNDEVYLALEHVESWTGVSRPLEGDVEFASTVKRFGVDDVLFGKLRPYLAKVTRATRRGVCVSEFLVLRPKKTIVLPAYLEQLLRCKRVIDLVNSSTAGAKMPRADWTFTGNMRLPVPPAGEQHDILAYITRETRELDDVIQRASDEIRLTHEYRDRLIADVVTGQIDVRGWKPGPDDVVSDDELAVLRDDEAGSTEEEEADGDN
ncbi:MAG TPA: NADAR domain-containing protein [Usitatibacter sp.]|nr:NADAR domain-containing protein [Usitatibacter sp.]